MHEPPLNPPPIVRGERSPVWIEEDLGVLACLDQRLDFAHDLDLEGLVNGLTKAPQPVMEASDGLGQSLEYLGARRAANETAREFVDPREVGSVAFSLERHRTEYFIGLGD